MGVLLDFGVDGLYCTTLNGCIEQLISDDNKREDPMQDQATTLKTISKFMSLVLRHQPGKIGLALDAAGWADVDDLLARAAAAGRAITRDQLDEVVATSDKRRFALSDDGRRIRANQGHSIDVDLGLAPLAPPAVLFHGTAARFVDSIRTTGLERRSRHHVHLTEDAAIGEAVGRRYGKPVVLRIAAAAMAARGHVFFRSANNVWLVESVPPEFIEVQA
jgi:putative RNA 2'-phosphotransferase